VTLYQWVGFVIELIGKIKINRILGFIALLSATKFVSWIIALASGTSGGTLAPMFTVGCGIGAIVAHAFNAMSASANVSITPFIMNK
jgi:H+/Cl- antiporter ClcA